MKKTIQFKSQIKNIHLAEQFCRSFLNSLSLKEDLIENILIVVTELVNNAIMHGNQSDPEKTVTLELTHLKKELICKVIDEGTGFNESQLEDPTKEQNLFKTSGRGIYIAKHFSNDFTHYMKNNNHVVEVHFNLR